jgi:hypothetical protein
MTSARQPNSARSFVFLAVSCACLLFAVRPAYAQTTYSYRGHNFNMFSCGPSGGGVLDCSTPGPGQTTYTTAGYVYGTLTLSQPLAPNLSMQDVSQLPGFLLTLNDSQQTMVSSNPGMSVVAEVSTDANGNIISPWWVQIYAISSLDNGITSADSSTVGVLDLGDTSLTSTGGDLGVIFNSPGVWFGARSGTAAWLYLAGAAYGFPFGPFEGTVGSEGQPFVNSFGFVAPSGWVWGQARLGGRFLLSAGAYSASAGPCTGFDDCTDSTGSARGLAYETFTNTGPDVTLRMNAILEGGFINSSGGEAYAAIYAVDATVFANTVPTGTGAAQYLLGDSSILDFAGPTPALALNDLFPAVLSTNTVTEQATVGSNVSVPVVSDLFTIAAGKSITIIFDVAAYSTPGTIGGGPATVDFSSTLAPAPVFFTDANGSPVTQVVAFIPAPVAPPAPATLTLSPSTSSNPVGTSASLSLTAADANGNPVPNARIFFSFVSGPNAPLSGPVATDANGRATLTYTGNGPSGTDMIQAAAGSVTSNTASVMWTAPGPLDHIAISPASSSILVGGSQTYSTQAFDKFNNLVGAVTGSTVFAITPDGSCTAATCTAGVSGPHTVTATYNGKAAQASLTVSTSTASQTISFTPLPSPVTYGVGPMALSATGGASGNPVTFSVIGPATLSGTILTITGAGTVMVTANQAGNTTYLAATPVSQTIQVNPAPLTILATTAAKILDAPNPPISNVTYNGFKLSDGPGSLGGTLSCSTTAGTTSPVGTYPITCSGLTSSNYAISYNPGTLKILYASAGSACDGDLSHTILQPVNGDGTSVWKQGRTIPAKFRVCDSNGTSIGTPGVVASFTLIAISSGTVTDVDETVASTGTDAAFRWDSTDQQWVFNISTANLNAGYTYVYAIALNDGSAITFQYGLR